MATKAAAKKAPAKKVATSLRIRMYRVGFGDFFLITVPSKEGPQHILVDCGVTRGHTGKGDIATIETAVRRMAEETKSTLALIIVTHRHQDHIAGFGRCAEEFKKFKVGAIWMPIWETEYEAGIGQFQAELTGFALSLSVAAVKADDDAATAEIEAIAANATGEGGGGPNAKSLKVLKTELGAKPKYLAKGDKPRLPSALADAGLAAQILGPPPVDDFDFLKLMDLKKGVGQYLDESDGDNVKQGLMPFEPKYMASAKSYPEEAFHEWAPRTAPWDSNQRYSNELENGVRSMTPSALLTAAKTLDGILNNQSLVVLFGWKGKKLLFAGDAQGGNWEYWLYGDEVEPSRDPTGLTLSPEGKKILSTLDFYKVGHHGSTNATPKPAVEAMANNFVSMCSTQTDTFGNVDKQTEVPRDLLLDELAKKSALVRSDQFAVKEGDVKVPAAVRKKVPTPTDGRFEVGSCYVDYFLDD